MSHKRTQLGQQVTFADIDAYVLMLRLVKRGI